MTTATLAPTAGALESAAPEWITLSEACRRLGVHETTVLRMAVAGDIAHRTRGRRAVFLASDVDARRAG